MQYKQRCVFAKGRTGACGIVLMAAYRQEIPAQYRCCQYNLQRLVGIIVGILSLFKAQGILRCFLYRYIMKYDMMLCRSKMQPFIAMRRCKLGVSQAEKLENGNQESQDLCGHFNMMHFRLCIALLQLANKRNTLQ